MLLDSQSSVGPATIHIDQQSGKISQIQPEYLPGQATLDMGDHFVMPGIVDGHVHINQPGRTQWEGVVTASKAAASGGVTAIVDMPLNCIPSTVTKDAYEQKRDSFRDGMWVDVGTWGGVVPGNSGDLQAMLKAGARGFKCFLCDSGVEEFPPVNEEQLRLAMTELKPKNGLIMFHAEMDTGATTDLEADPTAYKTFLDSRPPAMECKAIDLVIKMCREFAPHVPCHIVHLSAADALPAIRKAKQEGLPLTVETCFHYLTLSAEEVPGSSTEYKCCPPIREQRNRDQLWEAVLDGTIDFVVSDHSPCTPDLKLHACCGGKIKEGAREGDFVNAWGGIASVGIGLPLLWTEGRKRGLREQDVVRLICERTAQHSGLKDRKGKLAIGMDGDLVVWDRDAGNLIDVEKLHFRNKLTPYHARECQGMVLKTVVRGHVAYDQGKLSDVPQGDWLDTPISR